MKNAIRKITFSGYLRWEELLPADSMDLRNGNSLGDGNHPWAFHLSVDTLTIACVYIFPLSFPTQCFNYEVHCKYRRAHNTHMHKVSLFLLHGREGLILFCFLFVF